MKWTGEEKFKKVIESKLELAFTDLCLILTRQYTITISTPGIFPGYDGDIVDTGFFRASLGNPAFSVPERGKNYRSNNPTAPAPIRVGNAFVARFTWHASYSLSLYTGTTSKSGIVKPGRPWTDYTHKRFDVDGAFAKLFARKLVT
jgi:hypothetical protein